MNTEELTIIVNLIQDLSGNATTAFVFYIVCCKILPNLLIFAFAVMALFKVSVLVKDGINASENVQCLINIRDLLGVGDYGYINGSVRRKIMEKIGKDTI